jgi:hypothetical protein
MNRRGQLGTSAHIAHSVSDLDSRIEISETVLLPDLFTVKFENSLIVRLMSPDILMQRLEISAE